jgi:beta-lactamase class A
VSDLSGSHEWDLRGEEPFVAGDTIGLFILLELFTRADAGALDLGELAPVRKVSETGNGLAGAPARRGILASLSSVRELSLSDLAILVLAEADVLAMNALIDRLGLEAISSRAADLGATRTVMRRRPGVVAPPENYTCARDVALVWKAIALAPGFTKDTREEISRILRLSGRDSSSALRELNSADVRFSYDGDSPGQSAVVHAFGSIYLSDREMVVTVLGESLESERKGRDMMAGVAHHTRILPEGQPSFHAFGGQGQRGGRSSKRDVHAEEEATDPRERPGAQRRLISQRRS